MKKPSGRIKYKGITKHAQELHVTREHLWRVLEGERVSPKLVARYTAVLASTVVAAPALAAQAALAPTEPA